MNPVRLTVLLLAATPAVWAAAPATKPAKPPHPDLLVLTLDTDDDHTIAAAEIAAAPVSLTDLDLNDDGRLTPDEIIITPPAPPATTTSSTKPVKPAKPAKPATKPATKPTPPPPPVMVALDADKDGSLSAEEIASSSTALTTLDKNADGQLTRREFAPPPPKGGQTKPAK